MSNKKSLRARLQWKAEAIGFKTFELILRPWSLPSLYLLGELLGTIFFRFSTAYRAIVSRNLAVMLSDTELISPTNEQIEKVFRKNGGNLVTTLASGIRTPQELNKSVEIEGSEEINKDLQSSGVILVLAHMGNWELLTKCAHKMYPNSLIGALYRTLNNPHMNDLILERREKEGMRLISAKNPAFSIFKLLKKRGLMCILSDQKIGARGTYTPFFGKMTQCTRLPITLHEKTKVPVYTLSMKSLDAGHWKLLFSKIENPTQESIMHSLSSTMKESISDCFLFQDRWQALPNQQRIEAESEFQAKPLVAILEDKNFLTIYPEIKKLLPEEQYKLHFWNEGDSPANAYCAIGESKEFKKACLRVGIKRGFSDVKKFVESA